MRIRPQNFPERCSNKLAPKDAIIIYIRRNFCKLPAYTICIFPGWPRVVIHFTVHGTTKCRRLITTRRIRFWGPAKAKPTFHANGHSNTLDYDLILERVDLGKIRDIVRAGRVSNGVVMHEWWCKLNMSHRSGSRSLSRNQAIAIINEKLILYPALNTIYFSISKPWKRLID